MVMPYLFRQVADAVVHMLQPFHRVTLESSTEIMRSESPCASKRSKKMDATALRRGGSRLRLLESR